MTFFGCLLGWGYQFSEVVNPSEGLNTVPTVTEVLVLTSCVDPLMYKKNCKLYLSWNESFQVVIGILKVIIKMRMHFFHVFMPYNDVADSIQ